MALGQLALRGLQKTDARKGLTLNQGVLQQQVTQSLPRARGQAFYILGPHLIGALKGQTQLVQRLGKEVIALGKMRALGKAF